MEISHKIQSQGILAKISKGSQSIFFIPVEVHILAESSSIMVRHNSIIGVDTQITLNRRSRVGGLVRVKKKAEKMKLIIFSGDIHFPGKTNKAFRLLPPGGGKQNSKEYKKLKNWLYIQRMKLSRYEKKYFVLVQPVVPWEMFVEVWMSLLNQRRHPVMSNTRNERSH